MRLWPKRRTAELPPEEVLTPLPEPFRSTLLSMYANQPQLGAEGELYPLDNLTRITPAQGMWLYKTCRQLKPKQTMGWA